MTTRPPRLLPAALLLAAAAVLLGASPRRDRPLEVAIVAPDTGVPVFGEVLMSAAVSPSDAPVARVEFYVDGVQAGALTEPPWELVVQVGEENVAHRLEVIAVDPAGRTSSAFVSTGTVATHDSIDVELQPLFVRVERDGQPVRGLGREAFTVFDDGVPQRIVTFERGDVPFTAVVLLDGSVSMTGAPLARAVEGVTAFARSMQRLDEAKLLLFADRLLFETPFTASPPLLTLGLTDVAAGGGTALNDALFIGLSRLEPRTGRKVALVLSDGVDVDSVLSMEAVRALARRTPTTLYWLRLGGEKDTDGLPSFTPWRDPEAHGREKSSFREAVLESGGRVLPVNRPEDVRGALAAVLQELRDQYVIGFQPSRRRGSGAWHEVRVEVEGDGFEVRSHRGYAEP